MKDISSDFLPPIWHSRFFIRRILFKAVNDFASEAKGHLLDFGCGSKPYKSLFKNVSEYIGVDFENPGHDHQNEQIDIFYDGKNIPLPNEKFEYAMATEVFEHVFNLPELLIELNRVLKINGQLFFTCPFVWIEHEAPYDYARYTQFALKSELEKAGFEIIYFKKGGDFRTALAQMHTTYWADFISIKTEVLISKLPFLKPFRFVFDMLQNIIITLFNISGLLKIALFPTKKDLYLSNIVLAKKIEQIV
jgi:SAM-dependent methyltransferase